MIRSRLALLLLAGLLALLAGCSGTRSTSGSGAVDGYPRLDKDGAPWWNVDVSRIPDAVPTPYYGPVKANPYTVLGKTYYPMASARGYSAVGTASWYGTKFHGQATANGEKYDLYGMTAAHKTLPLPCYVRVTNLDNKRSVILRVNDRGPFYSDRIIDLSFAAAKKLGYAEYGTARVKVEGIDPVQWRAANGQPTEVPLAAAPVAQRPVENYAPPPQQHAAPVVPMDVTPAATRPVPVDADGLYLQVGAFANPDAAELLKDKLIGMVGTPVFVSSVVQNQQVLHRVRLGPIASTDEAEQLEQSLRQARLGNPRRVTPLE